MPSILTIPSEPGNDQLCAELARTFSARYVLISPPRTGSTAVARMLWQHPLVTHHCHEPFEACYWGGFGSDAVRRCLRNPMDIRTGTHVEIAAAGGSGLLIKEMTFQLQSEHFLFLSSLTTHPIIFVIRDPRLSAVSRLRVLKELNGAQSFSPSESGWPALLDQVKLCRDAHIPYLIVESEELRRAPNEVASMLFSSISLDFKPAMLTWVPRPTLRLCPPDVRALMGEPRTTSDPFYRRVLASTGVEPPDKVHWTEEESLLAAAGLSEHVTAWLGTYQELREDPNIILPTRSAEPPVVPGSRTNGAKP